MVITFALMKMESDGRPFPGAVFDLDGLLIDSEPIWMRAQQTALKECGADLTEAMQLATTGLRLHEAVLAWRGYFPEAELDPANLRNRLLQLVGGELRNAGRAKPGAIRALKLCRDRGCLMAIASSSPPAIIEAALECLEARSFFRAIVSAEEVAQGKPHPAVYLAAAERLGLAPAMCIAFEDSVFGLQSAKAAGMHCIAVPEAHNRGRAEYARADRVLHSLEELEEEHLLR